MGKHIKAKWKIPTVLCGVALCLCACSTDAQNHTNPLADVPPPDELRIISQTDATSTCIGDPKTPLCAVETLLACFARADIGLCHKMGVDDVELHPFTKTVKYKIASAKIMTEDDAKRDDLLYESVEPPEWWNPDSVELVISKPDGDDNQCHALNCRFKDSPPPVDGDCCKYTYIVNRAGNEWRVILWWWGGEY